MSRRIVLLLASSALVLGACGGESASSDIPDVTSPSSVAESTTTVAVNSPTTQAASTTSAPASPADVLVDLSYDIEAIDGPVVLWFWAPG